MGFNTQNMITYFFCEIGAFVLQLISTILSFLLGWTTILNLQGAITWLFSPLAYFGYWLDMKTLGVFMVSLMGFYMVWWAYMIFRFGWSAINSIIHGSGLESPLL